MLEKVKKLEMMLRVHEGVPSVPPILFVDPEAEDPRRIIDLLLGDKKQR